MNTGKLTKKYLRFKEKCVDDKIIDIDEIIRLFETKLKIEGLIQRD